MDRNTLLAIFLIALVLVFTPYYMEIVSPVPAQTDSLQTVVARAPDTSGTKEKLTVASAPTEHLRASQPVSGHNKEFIYNIEHSDKIVIIVSHQAILRVIYGYLMGINIQEIPHIDMPLNTLIECSPNTYNFTKTYIKL